MIRKIFINLQRQRDKDKQFLANLQYFKRINFLDYGKQEQRNKAIQYQVH